MYGIKTIFWSPESFLFYICVIVVSFILCKYHPVHIRLKDDKIEKRNKINIWLILTFVALLVVFGFRTVGRDLNRGYFINFNSATSIHNYRDQSVEIGFIILNVIIKRLLYY